MPWAARLLGVAVLAVVAFFVVRAAVPPPTTPVGGGRSVMLPPQATITRAPAKLKDGSEAQRISAVTKAGAHLDVLYVHASDAGSAISEVYGSDLLLTSVPLRPNGLSVWRGSGKVNLDGTKHPAKLRVFVGANESWVLVAADASPDVGDRFLTSLSFD